MRCALYLAKFALPILVAAQMALFTAAASAQTTEASPSPQPTAPQTEGGFDVSKLTPAQQQALRLAIIKASQNPIGSITALPFQSIFDYGVGPYARYRYIENIQPVIPIMLSKHWDLVARTIFPVIVQPSFAPPAVCASPSGCGSTFGIGDTQEELFFAPKTKPDRFIWGAGPTFQFPTGAPQDILGTGKWGAGVDAVGLVMPGNWVLGALVTQTWSVAGSRNFPDYSAFLAQPFVNYNFPHGWSLATAPIITATWTSPDEKWSVPVGLSVANTFKAGGMLMSLAVAYYSYVVRPVTSPQTEIKVNWTLLWPVKRGIDIQQLLQEAK